MSALLERVLRRTHEEDRGHRDPCQIWEGATDRDGYPHMKVSGKLRRAQRVVYEESIGPIPDGMEIDHLCHVVACLNPNHLEAVTGAENRRRRRIRRATEEACAHGHAVEYRNAHGDCRLCKREVMARVRARRRGEDVPRILGPGSRLVV